MKRSPDVELVLRDYFADDGLTAPDYVLDTVEGRISRQPQRRSWRLPRRNPMSTPFKLAAGLAAVVLVALVGWQLLPGRQDRVGGQQSPMPSAQPSATPVASSLASTAPSAGAACPAWYTEGCSDGAGILPPGTVTTRSFTPGFTFSVPEGWVNDGDSAGVFGLFPDTPENQAQFARSGGLAQSVVMGPLESPYFICEPFENNVGATAAEMVAAVVANEALVTSDPVDVTIGGLTGKQVDVRLNRDFTCPPAPDDPPGMNLAESHVRGVLLDAPGRGVLVIFVSSSPSSDGRFEGFLAEAMPIVQSFQFDLGQ